MFKNMKIGVKLISGFLLVAAIVVTVGVIGLTRAQQLRGNIEEIGLVRLPSIESLFGTEIGLEELMIAQRTLLSEQLDFESRSNYMEDFNKAREEYRETWDYFLTLPATAEEDRLSREFETQLEEWTGLNNQWLELNREFEAAGILDPGALVANIQKFRGDHYAVELDVAQLLLVGEQFEGGDDPTACNFGRWLFGFTTDNPELQAMLRNMREPHNRFHKAVGDIRTEVRAGNQAAAMDLFRNTMLPASEEVFVEFDKMIALAEEADAMRSEINQMVTGPIATEAYRAMDVLNELIHINEGIADTAVTEATVAAGNAVIVIMIGMIVGTLFAIIFGVILARAITVPLAGGVNFSEEIARGDLNAALDIDQKDEIGQLADAMRNMQKSLQYKANVVQHFAEGDLTVDIQKASEQDGLGASLITMKESLNSLLGQIAESVEQIADGSDQVSQASQSLSQGATEQAGSLEEITSSINEINSQSQTNTKSSEEANALSKQASTNANAGNEQMKLLTETMQNINSSAEEINKIVKIIDDISFQINLLALNANVEAARAGKYGKGFAVVAEEVRTLANRSGDSVKETSASVEAANKNIQMGTDLVEKTSKQLEDIVKGADNVAQFLDEITQASKEQTQGIDQITEGLDQIDQVTQGNTASAEETASAAEELASQAQQLRAMVAQFKLENERGKTKRIEAPKKHFSPDYAQSEQSGKEDPQKAPAGADARGTSKAVSDETGITTKNPSEVINLDDDDFDRF